jgi:hypothetical protein
VDIQGSEKEQTFYIAPGCGATGNIYATTPLTLHFWLWVGVVEEP